MFILDSQKYASKDNFAEVMGMPSSRKNDLSRKYEKKLSGISRCECKSSYEQVRQTSPEALLYIAAVYAIPECFYPGHKNHPVIWTKKCKRFVFGFVQLAFECAFVFFKG